MQLTFAQCFGVGATQDINTLVIQKSDLPGLTASASNTGESLVAGILLKILENFEGNITDEYSNLLTTENNIPITYNQGDIVDEFYLFKWRVLFKVKTGINHKVYQFVLHQFEVEE